MLKSMRKASFGVRSALGKSGDEDIDRVAAMSADVDRVKRAASAFFKSLSDFGRSTAGVNHAMTSLYPSSQLLAGPLFTVSSTDASVLLSTEQLDATKQSFDERLGDVNTILRDLRDRLGKRNLLRTEIEHYDTKLRKLQGSVKDKDIERHARNTEKREATVVGYNTLKAELETEMAALDGNAAAVLDGLVVQFTMLQAQFFGALAASSAEAVTAIQTAKPQAAAAAAAHSIVRQRSSSASERKPPPPVPRRPGGPSDATTSPSSSTGASAGASASAAATAAAAVPPVPPRPIRAPSSSSSDVSDGGSGSGSGSGGEVHVATPVPAATVFVPPKPVGESRFAPRVSTTLDSIEEADAPESPAAPVSPSRPTLDSVTFNELFPPVPAPPKTTPPGPVARRYSSHPLGPPTRMGPPVRARAASATTGSRRKPPPSLSGATSHVI